MPPFAFSRDARHLAVVNGNALELLGTPNLSGTGQAVEDLPSDVSTASFSPAGDLLAASTTAGEVDLLRVSDAQLAAREMGNSGQIMSLAWSGSGPHDEKLFAGGLDSQIVAYDVGQTSRQLKLIGSIQGGTDYLRPAGRYVVGIQPDEGLNPESKIKLWIADPVTGASYTFPLHMRDGDSIAGISVDGSDRFVLLTEQRPSGSITCRLFDFATGRVVTEFDPKVGPNLHYTFQGVLSPDGKTALVTVGARTLATYAVPSGRLIRTHTVTFPGPAGRARWAVPVDFAPNGSLLLWGLPTSQHPLPVPSQHSTHLPAGDVQLLGPEFEIVDPATARDRGNLSFAQADIYPVASWSPDRRHLAIGTDAGRLTLVDGTTVHVAGRIPLGPFAVDTLSYSPDGTMIVIGGSDGELSFADATTGRRIGVGVRVGDGRVSAWFDKQGDVVGYVLSGDGRTQRRFRYPGRASEWLATACTIAGGDLTRSDWAQYVTDRPYHRTCS
jgi:WD40 repeat protein